MSKEEKIPQSKCRVHGLVTDVVPKSGYYICRVCFQKNKKRYQKKYYEKNKDKINKESIIYKKKHPKNHKEYYKKNKDKINKYSREYYSKNKDKILENQRKRMAKVQEGKKLTDKRIKELEDEIQRLKKIITTTKEN